MASVYTNTNRETKKNSMYSRFRPSAWWLEESQGAPLSRPCTQQGYMIGHLMTPPPSPQILFFINFCPCPVLHQPYVLIVLCDQTAVYTFSSPQTFAHSEFL